MTEAPAVIVNLPGYPFDNFPSLATLALLRAINPLGLAIGDNYVVEGSAAAGDGGGGVFTWSPSSTDDDDGVFVIRPTATGPLVAGRWVLTSLLAISKRFSAGSGSSLVGYIAAGNGAYERTVSAKLRDFTPSVADYGGVGDGATDCRAAFAAADALGPLVVPVGLWLISSSITISNNVTFAPGARIVIPNGVTVTFNGGISASPAGQIFNLIGSGGVAGLTNAWFEWFAGDARANGNTTPTIDARPMMNAFATAISSSPPRITRGGSVGSIGPGSWKIDGTNGTVFNNCSLEGAGSGQTVFMWPTSVTNGLNILGNRGSFSGFQWMPLVPGTIPTDGTAIYCDEQNGLFSDIIVNDCYIGWDVPSTASTNTFLNCPVYGALYAGQQSNAQEQHWISSHVVSISDWTSLGSISGTFSAGDAISIPGGSGAITDSYGAGKFKIAWFGLKPTAGAAVTNATSGGTATISSFTPAHQLAAVYWYTTSSVSQCGNNTHDGDVIGGDWGLVIQGVNPNSVNNNPAFLRTDATFCVDTTWNGSKADKCYGCDFHGWFSSSRTANAKGFVLTNSNQARFNSIQCVNNSGQGLYVDNTNYFVQITNPCMDGNCANHTTTIAMAELALVTQPGAPVHDIGLTGGVTGYPGLFGIAPPLGLYVGNNDGTSGATASRVTLMGTNVADGKALINATQINGTNQRLRISCVQGLTDQ